jgi:hypothetical protein
LTGLRNGIAQAEMAVIRALDRAIGSRIDHYVRANAAQRRRANDRRPSQSQSHEQFVLRSSDDCAHRPESR